MGLMALWPIPDEPQSYKELRKKRINTWQKYKVRTEFDSGTPGQKASIITTELKRILPKLLGVVLNTWKQPCLKKWSPVTMGT